MKVYAKIACVMVLLVGNGVMGMGTSFKAKCLNEFATLMNKTQKPDGTISDDFRTELQALWNTQATEYEQQKTRVEILDTDINRLHVQLMTWRYAQVGAVGGIIGSLSAAVMGVVVTRNPGAYGAWARMAQLGLRLAVPIFVGSCCLLGVSTLKRKPLLEHMVAKKKEYEDADNELSLMGSLNIVLTDINRIATLNQGQTDLKSMLITKIKDAIKGEADQTKKKGLRVLETFVQQGSYNANGYRDSLRAQDLTKKHKKKKKKKKQTETENENEKQQQNTEEIIIEEEKKQ